MDSILSIRRFIVRLTLQMSIIGIICGAVFMLFAKQHYFSFVPFIFIYFFFLNSIVFYILVKSHNLSINQFSKRFMAITGIKFLTSLVFAVLFMALAKEHIVAFLVIFIILYFHSLFQLVREFLHFLKQKKVD